MNRSQWREPIVAFLTLVIIVERKSADKASPKLMTGKVTQVDAAAKTFTVLARLLLRSSRRRGPDGPFHVPRGHYPDLRCRPLAKG